MMNYNHYSQHEDLYMNEIWAIVELMGHVKLAGRLIEVERFGAKMGQLDVPTADGFITQFFGGGSVYRITAVSEQVVRDVAAKNQPQPVYSWDYPKQLASATTTVDEDDYEYEPEWATQRGE